MANMAIPKEQQTAYQRWEMSSFGEDKPSPAMAAKPKKKLEETDHAVNAILENIRKEAYTKGVQEGFAVGMAKAREHAEEERQQFLTIMQNFNQALEKTDEAIAEDLLALALDIAKSMLKVKLNVDTAAVIPVVVDAIHYLPHVQKPARILVHHEDAHILREYLAEEISSQQWQIQEDSSIERGGCLVETGANQIDASNGMRWKRITEALAKHDDWLLP
ncbi:flagellar assembly protein FliH [Methylotenera sp. 1P/1]|jgi:flagellar assembly protein FliH|uniref:flagellar assembly protein FliH n=1 Tax=Methylotenera sp. 1P/1 TaxID=1131551 RepID=UPI00035EED8F|nr:flagellar assembly protein FliH [Methylotenera sp. 1P/1]